MSSRNVPVNEISFQAVNELYGSRLKFEKDTSVLSNAVGIGQKSSPNRLVCQPMEGCDGEADGSPGDLTERRYLRLAKGGAGIIWFEATACLPEGRANPRQLWLNDRNLDAFKALVDKIRETGVRENGYAPLIIMQDTHSGRYSRPNGSPDPIIAYNNSIFEKNRPIDPGRIISDEGLDRVGEALVRSARLAEMAGFDGVDVKCCHRYLCSELLSAYERKGRYGGDFENRTRLLREAVKGAIQSVSRDFIVTTRLNVYDGFPYPYGFGVRHDGSLDFDAAEPVLLIKKLAELGVPLVNITMGNPYVNPHVNRPFANGSYLADEHPVEGVARMLNGISAIRREVGNVKLVASALSWLGAAAPKVAAAYIKDGDFDLAGLGRMTLAYPDFAGDVLKNGRIDPKKICVACSKCTELMRMPGGTPGCVVRDPLYTALYEKMRKGE